MLVSGPGSVHDQLFRTHQLGFIYGWLIPAGILKLGSNNQLLTCIGTKIHPQLGGLEFLLP